MSFGVHQLIMHIGCSEEGFKAVSSLVEKSLKKDHSFIASLWSLKKRGRYADIPGLTALNTNKVIVIAKKTSRISSADQCSILALTDFVVWSFLLDHDKHSLAFVCILELSALYVHIHSI